MGHFEASKLEPLEACALLERQRPAVNESRNAGAFSSGDKMRLEQHLAKTPAGLATRIAQRLLALTLGMLLNTLLGRPARSLVAYDGR
jgi:hypothetical protein